MSFAALQNVSGPASRTDRSGLLFAWSLCALFAAVYTWLGVIRYQIYRASVDDGLFTQAIASSFRGFASTTENVNHFAYHFSPVLLLLAPLLWVSKSALALIVVQAIAVALTMPPVYLIARRRVPAVLACAVALVAALYPALGGVAFTDFHENGFAPAAAAWLLWAIDARKLPWAACFAAICLCIKEDQALILAFVGIVGAIAFARQRERRWTVFCVVLTIASIATYATFMHVIQPAAGAGAPYRAIRGFFFSVPPSAALASLLTAPKIGYAFALLLPVLGICLLSRSFVLALPGLVECLASQIPITYTIGSHYAATWIPYLLVAFALGIASLWKRSARIATVAVAACIAIGIYTNVWASPNAWWYYLGPHTAEDAQLDAIVRAVPADEKIIVPYQVYAHLGMDPNATLYFSDASELLIDHHLATGTWEPTARTYLAKHPAYHRIYNQNGIELYTK